MNMKPNIFENKTVYYILVYNIYTYVSKTLQFDKFLYNVNQP